MAFGNVTLGCGPEFALRIPDTYEAKIAKSATSGHSDL